MSTTAQAPRGASGRKAAGKKPFWKREIGGKGKAQVDDEVVEHLPFVATLPQVNLLPAGVRQSVTLAHRRRWFIMAIVLLALVVGVVWWLQSSRIAEAEQRLAAAQAEGARLQAEAAALAPVQVFYTQLENQKTLVTSTLSSQPQASLVVQRVLDAGREAAGAPMPFSSIGITYQGIPAAGGTLNACPNPNPFGTEPTMGCLTFNATARNRQEVSRLLELMEADPVFVGPYVTSTSVTVAPEGGQSGVTFSGTAGVSLEGLATPLTQEQIDALLAPPQPAEPSEPAEEE